MGVRYLGRQYRARTCFPYQHRITTYEMQKIEYLQRTAPHARGGTGTVPRTLMHSGRNCDGTVTVMGAAAQRHERHQCEQNIYVSK
jgi:hypothetical protein